MDKQCHRVCPACREARSLVCAEMFQSSQSTSCLSPGVRPALAATWLQAASDLARDTEVPGSTH